MNKKLKIQSNGHSDDFQTPFHAMDILLPYIKKEWKVWDPADGEGNIWKYFREKGIEAVGTDIENSVFENFVQPELSFIEFLGINFDVIITNPPYSLKDKFLQRCYEYGKPFALLMPLTALEGKKRGELFRKFGIQLIIPNKRINFETPSGKGSGSWFATAWFCYKLSLPKDINFVELDNAGT